MNTDIKLKITEIQRFCMHDGDGIRTTVFLKGCPLRCEWCHNPETQMPSSELLFYKNKCIACNSCAQICASGAHSIGDTHAIDRNACVCCFACADTCPTSALQTCGEDMTVDEILAVVSKDSAFYQGSGGITLSGGEPFAQREKTVELLRAAKAKGFSVAVETCGYADSNIVRASLPYVDTFLWDIKDTDDTRHKLYTGVSNKLILDNLSLADGLGAKIRLRCILVNGVNTDSEHYRNLALIASSLKNLDRVEIIPYHAYGGTKSEFIGADNNGRAEWIPTEEQINDLKTVLKEFDITVI